MRHTGIFITPEEYEKIVTLVKAGKLAEARTECNRLATEVYGMPSKDGVREIEYGI